MNGLLPKSQFPEKLFVDLAVGIHASSTSDAKNGRIGPFLPMATE